MKQSNNRNDGLKRLLRPKPTVFLHNEEAFILSKENLILSKAISTKPLERDSFGHEPV